MVDHPAEGQSGFLAGLEDVESEAFLAESNRRAYPSGATLFFEGDPPDDVILLSDGRVKIAVTALDGREIVLDVIEPDVIMGELSVIDGQPHSASAVALTDCVVRSMTADRFLAFLDRHRRVERDLLVGVIADLRKQSKRTFELGVGDALGRVCRCLAEMADRYGTEHDGQIELDSPLNQTDLAAWAGLSREAVVKALRTLRSLDLIESQGRSFLITDLEAVRNRADV